MRPRKSAMGSSKYEFEPEQFEKDVKNKIEVSNRFKNDLREVLYRDYEYLEGKMSYKTKRQILIELHEEFIEKGGLQ